MTIGIQDSRQAVASIVTTLRGKGVKLWSDNGELRFRARKGVMSADEIALLAEERERIVEYLESAESVLQPRQHRGPVPLTYASAALWDSGRRPQRPPIRQIASATRLQGRLHLDVLRESLAEVVRRHEALRTRIVVIDGSPMQDIVDSAPCDLRVIDVTSLSPEQREQEVRASMRSLILEPFRFDVGPLLGVQLAKLGDEEHVLMVAHEHMISDALSLNIFLRDLLKVYARSLSHGATEPPPVTIQFADYAAWQRRIEKSWLAEHAEHWHRILAYPTARLPTTIETATESRPGWSNVSALISIEQKLALRNWCQSNGTTLAMSALTAFAALVLRSCNTQEGLLRCVTDGRTHPEIENTIGNFAAPMYLRISLEQRGTFLDLLTHLTREYYDAYRHCDLYYLQSTLPRGEAMRTPIFNWIPQEPMAESTLLRGSPDAISCSNVAFDNPLYETFTMDSDPILLLHDRSEDLAIELHYARNRFSAESMERFVQGFIAVIDEMVARPAQAI